MKPFSYKKITCLSVALGTTAGVSAGFMLDIMANSGAGLGLTIGFFACGVVGAKKGVSVMSQHLPKSLNQSTHKKAHIKITPQGTVRIRAYRTPLEAHEAIVEKHKSAKNY